MIITLGNGKILLGDRAVIDCYLSVSSAIRNAQSRDGLNAPRRLVELEQGLEQEARLAAAAGRTDVRESTFLQPFPQNVEVIGTAEAGRWLGLSPRQVRRLADTELDGRKVAGHWTFNALTVAAVAVDRKRAA
jgi:hypothetical protein